MPLPAIAATAKVAERLLPIRAKQAMDELIAVAVGAASQITGRRRSATNSTPEVTTPSPHLPALQAIVAAIRAFKRVGLKNEVEALHDFALIHLDTDAYDRAVAECAALPSDEGRDEDIEYGTRCLRDAEREIKALVRGGEGGDDGLARAAFADVVVEIEGWARDRREAERIVEAGLVDEEQRRWIERMRDEGDRFDVEMRELGVGGMV